MTQLRRVEILDRIKPGPEEQTIIATWVPIPFEELKKGHIFRMFESETGTPVDAGEVCVALCNAGPITKAPSSIKTPDGEPINQGSEGNFFVQSEVLLGF
jgi:hypothetical protein